MGKYITIEQYKELSNGSFMFNREYFNEFLERTTGIKAQKYEAYSYYDENGNYIGDSKKMNIVELLKNADIKVIDDIAPKRGKWEQDEHTIRCSLCGFGTFPLFTLQDGEVAHGEFIPYYCPNCGAKMDGGAGDAAD